MWYPARAAQRLFNIVLNQYSYQFSPISHRQASGVVFPHYLQSFLNRIAGETVITGLDIISLILIKRLPPLKPLWLLIL